MQGAAHVLAMDAKNLLDVVDSVRIKHIPSLLSNQRSVGKIINIHIILLSYRKGNYFFLVTGSQSKCDTFVQKEALFSPFLSLWSVINITLVSHRYRVGIILVLARGDPGSNSCGVGIIFALVLDDIIANSVLLLDY